MGEKKKNQRAHSRHNILHLKLAYFNFEGAQYPAVDLSFGGFSLWDKDWEMHFYKKSKSSNALFTVGPIRFELDVECMTVDNTHRMLGVKINKFHGGAKHKWKLITSAMAEAAKDNKEMASKDGSGFLINAKKFSVYLSHDQIKILKKGLFIKEKDIPYLTLGFVMGLPRKKYPYKEILQPILKKIQELEGDEE